jgi:hypothetical protein
MSEGWRLLEEDPDYFELRKRTLVSLPPRRDCFPLVCVVLAVLTFSENHAQAQSHDPLLNGVVIGAVVGAASGVAFTHAVRDSDLRFSQYARGALIFGAIGAGVGLGADALLSRAGVPAIPARRVLIAPSVWRDFTGVLVHWKW